MKLELVVNKYKKTDKDPSTIWSAVELDALRKTDCLCINCDRKNETIPYTSCHVAKKIYQICVDNNMSMAITKCGAVDAQGNLMYRPISK